MLILPDKFPCTLKISKVVKCVDVRGNVSKNWPMKISFSIYVYLISPHLADFQNIRCEIVLRFIATGWLEQGIVMLNIFNSCGMRSSKLDDFSFYQERQRAIQGNHTVLFLRISHPILPPLYQHTPQILSTTTLVLEHKLS